MSSVGSFGTFTTARLAIYVSQKGLSVTGNNIANINTVGYTRQRLDQVSFKTGAADRYQSASDMRVGNGALAKSVSQLRDPYLDVRYRTESASVGYHDGRLNILNQIQAILDETNKGENDGDGLLYAELQKYADALRHLQTEAGDEVNDTLVANSAKALAELFHSASRRLEQLRENTETQLRQEMDDINDLLLSIRKLNESIQQAEIYGDGALELRDERNNYIDELSEKLKISATYSMVDIGGKQVEKLTIRLDNANPDKDVKSDSSILVDGNYCAQLTAPKENLDADGNSVFISEYAIFDKKSTAYEEAVKSLKSGNQVANPDALNAFFTTQAELDAYIDTFMKQSANKMAAYQYLDPNGEGTNDPRVAAQEFDDYYNITVSDLRDRNNKAWVDGPESRDTLVKDDAKFPQKAVLGGSFPIGGGEWKDGDKINITVGGTDYSIVVGQDLSATAANDDPKNISNAIRQALLRDPDLAKNYDITTRTTKVKDGFNVDLTVKAKEPEEKAALPDIKIGAAGTAQPAGSVSFNPATPAEVTPATDPKTYTTKVGVTPDAGQTAAFHKGDKITFGTAPNGFTLEVGKDISVNKANDPKQLASVLAARLSNDKFTVTAKDDVLTFKAKAGVTDAPGALTATSTAATPATLGPLTITKQNFGKANTGVDLKPPAETVDNGDNTQAKVVTRYYLDDDDKWHQVVKTTTTSKNRMLDDNDLYGKLQAVREQLTEEGEFASLADIAIDENATIKRGIPYYQHALDLLARQFATTMNDANNGFAVDEKGNYLTKDGEVLEIGGAPVNETEGMSDAQKAIVEADALSNYIKTNFAGFVKNADGSNTNVLADKFGNPLKLGKTELTTDMLAVDGGDWAASPIATAVGINADGQFVDAAGKVITMADPADPTATIPVEVKIDFKTDAFLNAADPLNPTQEELDAAAAAKDAATADLNEQALDCYMEVNNGWKLGGDLFSNRGDTDDSSNITAANISVSQSWSKGDIHVVPTYIKLFGGDTTNTTQNLNALHMGNLVDRDLVYNPQDLLEDAFSDHMFEGSFNEMFVKMSTTLGNDQSSTTTSLQTHYGQALDIDTSRDSVSAVDLNDEAMDLMQYTHSLTAAYRLMTTIDDMLERLITGTGVTR